MALGQPIGRAWVLELALDLITTSAYLLDDVFKLSEPQFPILMVRLITYFQEINVISSTLAHCPSQKRHRQFSYL